MKLFYLCFDCPFTFIRTVTIPIYDKAKWNRYLFSMFPIAVFCISIYVFNLYDIYEEDMLLFSITLTISIILAIGLYILTDEEEPPTYPILISLLTFLMSLIWLWFLANILVDLLKTLGILLTIPETFLAMTVLTFGNSCSDLFLNSSLAKGGYGEMAMAGSIAGPLFNFLIGLGSSLLKINFLYGTIHIEFFKRENLISIIAIFTLSLNLIRLMIEGKINNYNLGKEVYIFSFLIYAVFFICICIISFG